jgi:hypothetical protein
MPIFTAFCWFSAGTAIDIGMDVRKNVMRKYLASLAFVAGLSAAPLFAATTTTDSSEATVAVQHVRVPVPGLRDEAAMVLVGTALIGLAAAVRRSA